MHIDTKTDGPVRRIDDNRPAIIDFCWQAALVKGFCVVVHAGSSGKDGVYSVLHGIACQLMIIVIERYKIFPCSVYLSIIVMIFITVADIKAVIELADKEIYI